MTHEKNKTWLLVFYLRTNIMENKVIKVFPDFFCLMFGVVTCNIYIPIYVSHKPTNQDKQKYWGATTTKVRISLCSHYSYPSDQWNKSNSTNRSNSENFTTLKVAMARVIIAFYTHPILPVWMNYAFTKLVWRERLCL